MTFEGKGELEGMEVCEFHLLGEDFGVSRRRERERRLSCKVKEGLIRNITRRIDSTETPSK